MDPHQSEETSSLIVVAVDDGSLVDIPPSSKNHVRDAHILSFSFFFIFCAYGAAQNLESTVNTVILVPLLMIVPCDDFALICAYCK